MGKPSQNYGVLDGTVLFVAAKQLL